MATGNTEDRKAVVERLIYVPPTKVARQIRLVASTPSGNLRATKPWRIDSMTSRHILELERFSLFRITTSLSTWIEEGPFA